MGHVLENGGLRGEERHDRHTVLVVAESAFHSIPELVVGVGPAEQPNHPHANGLVR